jgi:hypothetical protein
MSEISEFCRALDGGDHGTQCATEVKQSHYGKGRAMWLLDGGPGEIPSLINLLKMQVEDTVSELCG